ncbi:response regulator [Trinickia sp. NRRL B-1857]|uniref:response regulator transcription factor n=1 Tax=Trinickia sp. NRRL B-1857 TaxID=3162879 RepID=UPI003D2D04B1
MNTTPVIAVVDDDVSIREAMGQLIRSFDFAVRLYPSGPELLESQALDEFDCIVTDIQMPVMTGFALCEALRSRGIGVPIVFMTAFVKEGYQQRARDFDAACFLTKPFQGTDILRCIEHALRMRRR